MPFYEYKVVPAPAKSTKVRGLKGSERFARTLEALMNELSHDGWEFFRAETLPDSESKGIFSGSTEVMRNLLVFRRELYFEDSADAGTAASAEPEAEREPKAEREPERAPLPVRDVSRDTEAASMQDAEPHAHPTEWQEPGDTAPQEVGEDTVPRFSRRPLVADRKDSGSDR